MCFYNAQWFERILKDAENGGFDSIYLNIKPVAPSKADKGIDL